eukprot:GFKZ01013508.1.p1 GENE.GFKZ01013508.1~~GFKZ01013508.1.p1  ORF type:complete len:461 (+),score=81.41 GFKZ01013508.1:94-1476(+)
MRRNLSSSPQRPNMSSSTATKHNRYRPLPSSPPSEPRSQTKANRPATHSLCLIFTALAALSLSIIFLFTDLPLKSRIRDAFFSAGPPATSSLSKKQVMTMNGFGLDLFARVASIERDVFLSPASIASALAMVAAGATEGGPAEKEFQAVLPDMDELNVGGGRGKNVELVVANSAWLTGRVVDGYEKEVGVRFGADVRSLPDDVKEINAWVEKATKGRVKSMMESMPGDVLAILVNAVYFKGSWKTAFQKKDTVESGFKGDKGEGEVGRVRMMNMRKETFGYMTETWGESGGIQAVELPYGTEEEFGAVLIVPSGRLEVRQVVEKMGKVGVWDAWMEQLVKTKLDVVAVPRFKLEYGTKSLKEELQQMGLKKAFTGSESGEFLKMSMEKSTYLDDVLHKAGIECTEEGTVASAATEAVMMFRSLPRPKPRVIADRPFVFVIRNRVSGAVLFAGRIDKPVSV